MTRWQVFGGRYDGERIDTSHDDEFELRTLVYTLAQQRLTFRDIDTPGVSLTITITKEQAHD